MGSTEFPPLRNVKNSIEHFEYGIGGDMAPTTSTSIYQKAKEKEAPKQEEKRHHDRYPPSSFPAFSECPCYRPSHGEVSEAANRGTILHDQLQEILDSHDV